MNPVSNDLGAARKEQEAEPAGIRWYKSKIGDFQQINALRQSARLPCVSCHYTATLVGSCAPPWVERRKWHGSATSNTCNAHLG